MARTRVAFKIVRERTTHGDACTRRTHNINCVQLFFMGSAAGVRNEPTPRTVGDALTMCPTWYIHYVSDVMHSLCTLRGTFTYNEYCYFNNAPGSIIYMTVCFSQQSHGGGTLYLLHVRGDACGGIAGCALSDFGHCINLSPPASRPVRHQSNFAAAVAAVAAAAAAAAAAASSRAFARRRSGAINVARCMRKSLVCTRPI